MFVVSFAILSVCLSLFFNTINHKTLPKEIQLNLDGVYVMVLHQLRAVWNTNQKMAIGSVFVQRDSV